MYFLLQFPTEAKDFVRDAAKYVKVPVVINGVGSKQFITDLNDNAMPSPLRSLVLKMDQPSYHLEQINGKGDVLYCELPDSLMMRIEATVLKRGKSTVAQWHHTGDVETMVRLMEEYQSRPGSAIKALLNNPKTAKKMIHRTPAIIGEKRVRPCYTRAGLWSPKCERTVAMSGFNGPFDWLL
jgi:hypothetical protein